MNLIKLYPGYEEAYFVERLNRFVMQLKKKDGTIFTAYVANPGRMEEFQIPGHPFFLTTNNTGKYFHRVVATTYQDSYLLLDTIKINALVEKMLKNNMVTEFQSPKTIRREFTVERSKFDFLIDQAPHTVQDAGPEMSDQNPAAPESTPGECRKALLEIKSCSLCHRGVAMFPDAPTTRGKRHLEDLNQLAAGADYDTYTMYLITHKHAHVFAPNGHTDPDYCRTFNESKNIRCLAYSVNMPDPVTVDIDSLKRVPIDMDYSHQLEKDRGTYLIVFHNAEPFEKTIGSLGKRHFKEGYYVYVGSAMKGMENRLKRHLRKTKKTHWHLDYISPSNMKAEKVFPIRWPDRLEESLAAKLTAICTETVPGFGASDSSAESHLFYFPQRPWRLREFIDMLLDARMNV
ncbi:MAG: DUF123 domain-containing protein [bacterium]|nr:DUF123 domain-containing protein [bacterium]